MKKYLSFIVALMVTLFTFSSFAFTPPEKPANGWYVLDQAGKLTQDQVNQLNQKIENLNRTTKNEYAVLVVSGLDGDSIEDAAQDTFRAWGVGKKDLNNGVLFIVAVGDHKMRIQTGKGAEGDLPDLLCKDILDQQAKPNFKKGHFYEGINATIDAMAAHMESRATDAAPSTKSEKTPALTSSGSGGGCSIVGTVVGGFAVVSMLALLTVIYVVRRLYLKGKRATKALLDSLDDDEVTLPRIQTPVTQRSVPLPVVAPVVPVPVVRSTPVVHVPVPTPAVHPAPVVTAPRPSTSTAAVGLGAGAAALALAEASRREEQERAARKRREREEEEERARRARRRREEEEEGSRRSSYSDTSSSSFDIGGFGGGGFGGGDSGGGGASSDW